MFSVNTNMSSQSALNHLNSTSGKLSTTFERISSGLRINSAKDDAAGLGVSENLDAQQRSLRQASRNANDGLSMIEVAEGAAEEASTILKRMRELAVQSASETLEDTERAYIGAEYDSLTSEMDRIANITEFNGVKLTDGTNTDLDIQIGINGGTDDVITVALSDMTAATLGVDALDLGLDAASASAALATIDTALDTVNSTRAGFGATQNRIESGMRNLATFTENISAAQSRIQDADFAAETSNMAKFQIMQQAGVSVLAQANQINQSALKLIG
jgi:flagellin